MYYKPLNLEVLEILEGVPEASPYLRVDTLRFSICGRRSLLNLLAARALNPIPSLNTSEQGRKYVQSHTKIWFLGLGGI